MTLVVNLPAVIAENGGALWAANIFVKFRKKFKTGWESGRRWFMKKPNTNTNPLVKWAQIPHFCHKVHANLPFSFIYDR